MNRIILILIAILLGVSSPAYANVTKENRQWQDETIYSIMIDRFNNGNTQNDFDVDTKNLEKYNGGDFQGIIDKLDYIKDMEFTAIRLTPIFDNRENGYHGYWVKDYYKVDEHFGTMKDFEKLVNEAHKRKLRVIIDFPANSEVKGKNLIDAATWWIKKTNIDGYSLPEVNKVPISFWREFSAAVKQEKKDFLLMGVSSGNTADDLEVYHEAGIDSLFDYNESEQMRQVFATTDRSFQSIPPAADKQNLDAHFFDNEFTKRFTKDIVDERQFPGARWKTALTYIYTTPGIPVMYYGTEIALTGGDIPDNRRLMNFRTEKDLIDYITKLGELRNQLPSLTRGTMEMLYEKSGMAVYKRVYKGETSIIAINNTNKSQKVTLTGDQVEGGKELRGLLGGDLVRSRDNQYILIVDRDNSEIYVLAEKTGFNLKFIAAAVIPGILAIWFLLLVFRRGKTNIVE
ncbi:MULTISPECIES: alpha-amylase family glycosyl hydrolase [Neobacillus]|uniref:alpha-amylase n=1 Tax=Neobacillus rhizophilus TaxID=2833579 RepID=A0A942U3I8_9BACI|nr:MULTISPECIES: alpha-amylase family glycosyl hydrolase [Neobacillus]MBS4212182.1 alpha-amylase [Neobacillus rhizophilus]MBU8915611.1 alpha-amylase [Bacillus sp. FJAT-29953]